MNRAALYLRVSSDRQTTANQRPDLEAFATRRGLSIARVYEETESAVKHRPAFEQMKKDGRAGHFDVLLIWRLDRFGRSMTGNMADVAELDRAGVRLISVREDWLDSTAPTRALLIAILSWVAEQERATLIERTRAGLTRAKAQGKRLGRPRASLLALGAAARAMVEGTSATRAARDNGVSVATLRRYRAAQKGSARPNGTGHHGSTV